jgi:hypothetical protein
MPPPGEGIPVYDAATEFFGMSVVRGGIVREDVFVHYFREEFPNMSVEDLRRVYADEVRFWVPIFNAARDRNYAYIESVAGPIPPGWQWNEHEHGPVPDVRHWQQSPVNEVTAFIGTIIQDVINMVFATPPPRRLVGSGLPGMGKQEEDTTFGEMRLGQRAGKDPGDGFQTEDTTFGMIRHDRYGPPSWWEGTFSEWIDYETAGPYYT